MTLLIVHFSFFLTCFLGVPSPGYFKANLIINLISGDFFINKKVPKIKFVPPTARTLTKFGSPCRGMFWGVDEEGVGR
jgi:hypothetical protein